MHLLRQSDTSQENRVDYFYSPDSRRTPGSLDLGFSSLVAANESPLSNSLGTLSQNMFRRITGKRPESRDVTILVKSSEIGCIEISIGLHPGASGLDCEKRDPFL